MSGFIRRLARFSSPKPVSGTSLALGSVSSGGTQRFVPAKPTPSRLAQFEPKEPSSAVSAPAIGAQPPKRLGLTRFAEKGQAGQTQTVAARFETNHSNPLLDEPFSTDAPLIDFRSLCRPSRLLNAPAIKVAGPVEYSDEQAAIIFAPERMVVGAAFAGTGKTTTAVGVATENPGDTLYLAFTRANQIDAEKRFAGTKTTVLTTHALAFRSLGYQFKRRLPSAWRAMTVKQDIGLNNTREAVLVQQVLNAFFYSNDSEICSDHAAALKSTHRASDYERQRALQNAHSLWERMNRRDDTVAVPHDAYLKMWALSCPQLPFDRVIFDEYQDSNPVTAGIVASQEQCKVLYLGDRHQAIYGFRGARDALDLLPAEAKTYYLSQTRRFGPEVASFANQLLSYWKEETVPIRTMKGNGTKQDGNSCAVISRTNARLFAEAFSVRGVGVHWVGGLESYNLSRLSEAVALNEGRIANVQDQVLRQFCSFSELREYADTTKDSELRIITKLVDDYGSDLPSLIEDVRRNQVPVADQASLILTTAHKSKGLEFPHVRLADDMTVLSTFTETLREDPGANLDLQEINLLYVAATRAEETLELNSDSIEWLAQQAELEHDGMGVGRRHSP